MYATGLGIGCQAQFRNQQLAARLRQQEISAAVVPSSVPPTPGSLPPAAVVVPRLPSPSAMAGVGSPPPMAVSQPPPSVLPARSPSTTPPLIPRPLSVPTSSVPTFPLSISPPLLNVPTLSVPMFPSSILSQSGTDSEGSFAFRTGSQRTRIPAEHYRVHAHRRSVSSPAELLATEPGVWRSEWDNEQKESPSRSQRFPS